LAKKPERKVFLKENLNKDPAIYFGDVLEPIVLNLAISGKKKNFLGIWQLWHFFFFQKINKILCMSHTRILFFFFFVVKWQKFTKKKKIFRIKYLFNILTHFLPTFN
jgi:hypothetical protein